MSDGRRFEDKISIEDLMKKPVKELLIMNYMQVTKTNGTVQDNCKDIEILQKEIKDKIGWKVFTALTGIIAFVIILFQVLDYIKGI